MNDQRHTLTKIVDLKKGTTVPEAERVTLVGRHTLFNEAKQLVLQIVDGRTIVTSEVLNIFSCP